jgi:hypothetical protein
VKIHRLRRYRASRLIVLGLVAVMMGGAAPARADASSFWGQATRWTPRGNAPVAGRTSVSVKEMTTRVSVSFVASNRRTVFRYDGKRLSRNRFFQRLRKHPDAYGLLITWSWKTVAGHRRRYCSKMLMVLGP